MAKLGDIATYINGYAFKPSDWSNEGLEIIRIQNLTGNAYEINRYNGEYNSKFEVNDGDVLISWSASLGVYVWNKGKALLNQHIFKVVFDKKVDINKDFFVYQVENLLKCVSNEAHGATMKHLTKPVFDGLPFYLPDLETQNVIAKRLNGLNNLILNHKKQISDYNLLVKSRFIEMFGDPDVNEFGWNEEKLGDCLSVIGGYAFKSSDFKESGVPILRIGNINTGSFRPTNLVYWKNDIALDRYKIYPGDLVMSLTGTVGKDDYGNVCILGDDYPTYYLNQRNAKLVLGDKLNKIYLAELLKWPKIKNRLTGISRGIRQANISNKDIVELNVPIPSIEIQNQFADFVAQVDKSKLAVQQSLNELETLKKSLMQQYFG